MVRKKFLLDIKRQKLSHITQYAEYMSQTGVYVFNSYIIESCPK